MCLPVDQLRASFNGQQNLDQRPVGVAREERVVDLKTNGSGTRACGQWRAEVAC
jgi:hypothetical protein